MKNQVLTAVASLLLLTSCSKVKYLADVDVNMDLPYSKEFAIPAIDSTYFPEEGMVYSFPKQEVATNSQDEMTSHSLTPDRITDVSIETLDIESIVKQAKSQGFDFVDNMQIYLSAEGLPEVMIAQQANIPDNSTAVKFDCVDQDLKAYFLKEKVFVRLQGHFNSAPKAEKYEMSFNFNVSANLTNQD